MRSVWPSQATPGPAGARRLSFDHEAIASPQSPRRRRAGPPGRYSMAGVFGRRLPLARAGRAPDPGRRPSRPRRSAGHRRAPRRRRGLVRAARARRHRGVRVCLAGAAAVAQPGRAAGRGARAPAPGPPAALTGRAGRGAARARPGSMPRLWRHLDDPAMRSTGWPAGWTSDSSSWPAAPPRGAGPASSSSSRAGTQRPARAPRGDSARSATPRPEEKH